MNKRFWSSFRILEKRSFSGGWSSYTDWGAASFDRRRDADAREPHIITHLLLALIGVPIVIFCFGEVFIFPLGGFSVMFSIMGFVEDYKKIKNGY